MLLWTLSGAGGVGGRGVEGGPFTRPLDGNLFLRVVFTWQVATENSPPTALKSSGWSASRQCVAGSDVSIDVIVKEKQGGSECEVLVGDAWRCTLPF